MPRRNPQADMRQFPPLSDDERAYVVDEDLFRFMVDVELRQGLRLQYPVTVVTLLASTAGEGSASGVKASEVMADAARRVIRRSDLISPLSQEAGIRLLLLGTLLDDAEAALGRVRAELPAAVGVGVACFPTTASSAAELLARADAQAREGGSPDPAGGPGGAHRVRASGAGLPGGGARAPGVRRARPEKPSRR